MDELFALLEMLKMAIIVNQSEQSDQIMKQIASYSYDDEIQAKVDKLNISIVNFEADEALEIIEEMQK